MPIIAHIPTTTITVSTSDFSPIFVVEDMRPRLSEVWNEQARTKDVDKHSNDQNSFQDTLGRACSEGQRFLGQIKHFSLRHGYVRKYCVKETR